MATAGVHEASRARVGRILLPFAFGYALSYLYRSVNAIIAPDLTAQFNLSPAQLGLLTSAYFLAFAAFQLPLGLLLDRFGPRCTDAALLVVATVPVEAALGFLDWRVLFALFAVSTLAAAVVIFGTVPERVPDVPIEPLAAQLEGQRKIFATRRFWGVTLAATATQATNMSVQGLWAGPWLRDVGGLSRDAAAAHLPAMAVATMAGFLLWGNLAGWLARRGVSTLRLLAAGRARPAHP